jgi:hypothetical protein
MCKLCFALLSLAFVSTYLSAQTQTEPAPALHKRVALSEYGNLPLSFEANLGQTDGQVKFLSRGSGFSLFLTNDEALIALKKTRPSQIDPGKRAARPTRMADTEASSASVKLRMQVLGANTASRVVGAAELPGKVNYFIGNDPAKWRTNVPTYAQVKYENVYPGVDLIYYGNRGRLEYDFVVAPGADPGLIALRFRGGSDVAVDQNGDLLLNSEDVRFQKPVVYQNANGARKSVESRYVMAANNTMRFMVGDYDRNKPLIIDPVLVYSTYLGGSVVDSASGIAVDASQNAYVIGTTQSTDFPTANAIQPVFPSTQTPETDPFSVFITKINASGSALVFSTYLGGSGPDFGFGIAVDPSGSVYATGRAASDNFPTVNPIQPQRTACCGPGAGSSAFITKLNPAGSAIIYSTYLGGFGEDWATAIAADAAGNAYITGFASSPLLEDCPPCSFPTTPNALQPNLGGVIGVATNAFVTKINPDGSALVFSTYLGGSGRFDVGTGIAVDPAGNVYVTGNAVSNDFPTANAIQPTQKAKNTQINGNHNAFVSKINPSGTAFVYSTYLGGSTNDGGGGITADSSGNAYVTGQTQSADFPTVKPLQSTLVGSANAFLAKISPSGSAIVYSTFLGGSGSDGASGVTVDHLGDAYIAGGTASTDFPTVNALQPTFGGGSSDAFVTEINATGNALVYSTFLGGSGDEGGGPIALDPLGNVYVAGSTNSTNFPAVNALQHALGGSGATNAFVSKIGSTIAARLNLSGVEFFAGHPCTIDGQHATCGAHFLGWSGGSGHVPNGWVAFPGDGKAVWEANIDYGGDAAFGKTINLSKGSRLELLLKKEKLLSETVTEGTVVWPLSATDDLGCGAGVAKVRALFTTKQGDPASFVGCLHDLPAGRVIPPKIWGTFFTLKDEMDENNQSHE